MNTNLIDLPVKINEYVNLIFLVDFRRGGRIYEITLMDSLYNNH